MLTATRIGEITATTDNTLWWRGRHPSTPDEAIDQFLARCSPTNSEQVLEQRRNRYWIECRVLQRNSGIMEVFPDASIKRLDPRLPAQFRTAAGMIAKLVSGGDIDLGQKAVSARLMALCGHVGTGKTNLACGLVNAFCACNRSARYVRSIGKLFREIKDTFVDHSTSKLLDRLERYHLLVIDEGQVRDADKLWQDNQLTDLINARFLAGRPTLLITNLMPAPFARALGESVLRRIGEGGGFIEANWGRIDDILAHAPSQN